MTYGKYKTMVSAETMERDPLLNAWRGVDIAIKRFEIYFLNRNNKFFVSEHLSRRMMLSRDKLLKNLNQ